jgi:hypothetical protein
MTKLPGGSGNSVGFALSMELWAFFFYSEHWQDDMHFFGRQGIGCDGGLRGTEIILILADNGI